MVGDGFGDVDDVFAFGAGDLRELDGLSAAGYLELDAGGEEAPGDDDGGAGAAATCSLWGSRQPVVRGDGIRHHPSCIV
jgi:hypothetical protein